MWPFGIFSGDLVYFEVINVLVFFVPRNAWQPCSIFLVSCTNRQAFETRGERRQNKKKDL
jgi:hypothetical protein